MAPEETTPLPKSRAALEQARRLLDELPARERSVQEYRDHVPYVLERLDHVWRTIDAESRGRRTPEFGEWWAGQTTSTRNAIKWLRNQELKHGVQSTRKRSRFAVQGFMRVHENGRMTWHREDGSEIEPGPQGVEVSAKETESLWDFAVPGLEDQPVQDLLETVYTNLADRVLPTAERLLREAE